MKTLLHVKKVQATFEKREWRWLALFGAVLVQLPLGVIYSWSAFTWMLKLAEGDYNFTNVQTLLPMGVALLTFAFVMLFSGKWLAMYGPRRMTIAGGTLLGAAYLLAGIFGNTWYIQTFFIGLIGGGAIGMAYIIPIDIAKKWYKDHDGLATGIAVAGFGGGAFLWILLAGIWGGGLLNTTSIAGLPGVQSVFIIYGIIFTGLILCGSVGMVNPKEGWVPAGYKKSAVKRDKNRVQMTPAQMRKTPQYKMLVSAFFLSALSGLMVIGVIKLFGTAVLPELDSTINVDEVTYNAGAWLAIFNSIGRIVWGLSKDKFDWQSSFVVMTALQGVTILLTYPVFVVIGHGWGLIVYACIIGFNFGGNFALMPAATSELFGDINFSINYPWVFLPYGPAGFTGVFLPGIIVDLLGGNNTVMAWMAAFLFAGIATLLSSVISARIPPLVQTKK